MDLPNILRLLKQKFYNRDVAVFLVFLLLALFVWFLNKLSHDYFYTIEYPVELYSTQNRQISFNEKDATLTIQQRMDGFSILKSKVTGTPTIRIDLNPDKYYKASSTPNTYYALTKNFAEVVDRQLGDDKQLIAMAPDTLFFTVGVLSEKKVPVHHQLKITTEKEYMLRNSIVLVPDSVIISGSQDAINEISFVKGNPQTLVNLTESVEGAFDVLPIKGVHISNSQIRYIADVTRYTEGIHKTTIRIEKLPSNIAVTLLPNEVEIKYRVAIADFPSVDTSQLVASVSYEDMADSEDRTLAVQLARKPKEVLSVQIIPPFVEYIIRKN